VRKTWHGISIFVPPSFNVPDPFSRCRGRKIFEPPRFMSIPTAVSQLLSLIDPENEPSSSSSDEHLSSLDPSRTLAISASRLGAPDQKFVAGTLEQLAQLDEGTFGPPLHSLVIVGRGKLHPVERDFAAGWAVDREVWERVSKDVYGCQE
jgi:diphthine synthase